MEPMADAVALEPRTLQQFLSLHEWDENRLRDLLQRRVAREHCGALTIGVIDETSHVKKGDKTPGVKRQWCGRLGKVDNCVVTVHLAYVADDFHCLVDGELFLPEDWSADRERCRRAHIPDDVVHRPKWRIALAQRDRAVANGIHFDWLTFDEGYPQGTPRSFSLMPRAILILSGRGQADLHGLAFGHARVAVTRATIARDVGRGCQVPRLAADSPHAQRADEMLRRRDSGPYPAVVGSRMGRKGRRFGRPSTPGSSPRRGRFPGEPLHLLVARNVLNPQEIKFFVSNAAPQTPVATLLLVGFSRWHVERCFEDQKGEVAWITTRADDAWD